MAFLQILLTILIGLTILIFLIFIYGSVINAITRLRERRIFNYTFTTGDFTAPTIEFSRSYSWTTYKITFESVSDYQAATEQGLMVAFENEIAKISHREFDPSKAISYAYLPNKPV